MSVKKRGQIHCRFRQTYEQTYLTPRTHIHTNENVHSENGNGESVYGARIMRGGVHSEKGNGESVYGAVIIKRGVVRIESVHSKDSDERIL